MRSGSARGSPNDARQRDRALVRAFRQSAQRAEQRFIGAALARALDDVPLAGRVVEATEELLNPKGNGQLLCFGDHDQSVSLVT